ncbi:asparagine synthetase B family protein [Parafrankia elaeagni]|uniref:asparagine synthetase B family protein n=1 Tax=Parafrankia elaeagni TaxID=222534 RepID=UPI000374D49A|nr:asparagine synthase-related protein [Parafrankia elaeagni]
MWHGPDLLRHRGPDGSGQTHWSAGGASGWLLHTRLAIVDLSDAGRQPMSDERGRFLLAFNGEIYNHRELRRICEARGHQFASSMDGEVIVHLWEDEGPECLRRLDGIFALALVDQTTGEVWLARDPLGVKPLFFQDDPETLWFASEPGAIPALGADPGPVDIVALAQLLTFLWIPDPRTPHTRVRSVLPGELLRWRAGDRLRRRSYGPELVPDPDPAPVPLDTAAVQLEQHLTAACRRQMLGDVPVALMASGGVDSSLLWWGGLRELAGAYTIEWPAAAQNPGRRNSEGVPSGEGSPGSRTGHHRPARHWSERLDEDAQTVRALQSLQAGADGPRSTPGTGLPVTFLPGERRESVHRPLSGDLFADPAYELTRLIAARARADGRKVLWSGQGGDELLAGYRRHRVARLLADRPARLLSLAHRAAHARRTDPLGGQRLEYLTRLVRAASAHTFLDRYLHLCTYSDAQDRARVLGCTAAEVGDDVVWARHREIHASFPPGLSALRQALTLDLRVYLPGLGLAYVDRAGMEFGVEIRVPWLDLGLVRWSLALPDDVLTADGGKGPARALARKVLPPVVATRAKRGFAAPVERLHRSGRTLNGQGSGTVTTGARGFRQASYFSHAATLITALVDEGSPQ